MKCVDKKRRDKLVEEMVRGAVETASVYPHANIFLGIGSGNYIYSVFYSSYSGHVNQKGKEN